MTTQVQPLVDLLAVAGSVVAIAASLLGLIVTVQQVTAPTRLRRQSAHWREELSSEVVGYDALLFQSLRRQAVSRLIALQAVPGRRIVGASMWIAMACLGAFLVGKVAGGNTGPGYVGAALSSIVILHMGVAMCMQAILDRKRIAKAYLDKQEVYSSRHPFARYDTDLVASVLARRGRTYLGIFVASIWVTLLSAGFMIGASGSDTTVPLVWVVLLFGLPLITSILGISLSFQVYRYRHEDWRHPRAPSEQVLSTKMEKTPMVEKEDQL